MKIKLGMRTIKTGLGILLSLFICDFFGLENRALAAATAVIGIQPSLLGALKKVKEQMVATIVGCIIAVIIGYYFAGNSILLALTAMLIILFALRFGLGENTALAILTIVLFVSNAGGDSFTSVIINRIVVISIGFITALFLNFLIPPRHTTRLLVKIDELRVTFEDFYKLCIDDLLQSEHKSRETIKEHTKEIRDLIWEARQIYVLSIENNLRYKEEQEKDINFLIRKAINAVQSNLERLLEIHRSIVLVTSENEDLKRSLHNYLNSIYLLHQKIYEHILSGKDIDTSLIEALKKEKNEVEKKVLQEIRLSTELPIMHYYNILAEGERILNKSWNLIKIKMRYDISVAGKKYKKKEINNVKDI